MAAFYTDGAEIGLVFFSYQESNSIFPSLSSTLNQSVCDFLHLSAVVQICTCSQSRDQLFAFFFNTRAVVVQYNILC